MAAITFGGLASGLPPDLVDKLVEAERIPIKNIEKQKGKSENRLKLVQELETKLNAITGTIGTLASTKGFQDIKLVTGDPNIIQGTVDPGSGAKGNWNIEVVQLAQKSAAVTNGFPDKDRTTVGVGYFRFKGKDGWQDVYINGSGNTLEGVANKINSAGVGVRANVINDRSDKDYPYKLMIAGSDVGDENYIEYPTLYFLDGDQDIYFDDKREAKNGIVKVDGFEFQIADNVVKDVIPGVTLDLKQAAPGRSVNVSVKEDQQVVVGKIKSFVEAMNGVLQFIQSQNKLDEKTDTSQTLGGDSLLRSIESRMRRLIQDPIYGVAGNIKRLNQLGIQINRNGLLDYSEEKFNSILANDPVGVQQFFAGDGFSMGFVPQLKREISTVLNTAFGPIANRKRALQQKIDQADQNIANKEKQLTRKEETLRNKFAKLEETMSRLKTQGSALGGLGGGMMGGGAPG